MVKRLIFILLVSVATAGCDTHANIETYFTPGPDCENHIIDEINKTNSTLDIAVYSITNARITDTIVDAHHRGVRVRIITDRAQAKIKNASAPTLRHAGIRVVLNKKHKIMHHKFAVFDGRRVVNGSYNWTENASKRNAENCDFFDLSNNKYHNRFEYLWNFYNTE